MKIVTLMTCGDSAEANIIKGHLQNEEIPCFLTNQNYTDLYGGMSFKLGTGIQIQIREEDLEKAAKIIRETYPEQYGQVEVKTVCPKCGSGNVKLKFTKPRFKMFLLVILSVLAMVPATKVRTEYFCKDCKAVF